MVALVNFDIKERQPREQMMMPKRESMETPRAINADIDKNFRQKLLQIGSTIKERTDSNTIGQMPETGLYRDPYDIHNYDNQFQIESSIKRMMDDADRLAHEEGMHFNDKYLIDPQMEILNDRMIRIEGMENQINELMNITPDKLHKFEAEFRGESQTKRKLEGRNQQRQIDENLEARIEKVIEGYEKLGEMKLTIDKILNKILGDQTDKKTLEPLVNVNPDVKDLLEVIEGHVHDTESKFIS